MLHVALVNDLRFGGVRLLADQQKFNEGEFMRRPNVADQRAGPVADSDDDLAPSNELPRVRSDASVDVELGLCRALGTWDPWVTPTEHIVDNLRDVKASETSSSDHDPSRACLLRQQVIHQLQHEADHFDSIPERFKYHAAARWKLQCDHVCWTGKRRAKQSMQN